MQAGNYIDPHSCWFQQRLNVVVHPNKTKMQKEIDEAVYKRLEKIEREVHDLKVIVLRKMKKERVVSIGGLLRNVRITNQDIKRSKSTLFCCGI